MRGGYELIEIQSWTMCICIEKKIAKKRKIRDRSKRAREGIYARQKEIERIPNGTERYSR